MSKISSKWLPAFLVPAVVALTAVAIPLQANAVADLPDKTPAEVLLMISNDAELAFSGTILKTADLGLPAFNMSSGMTSSMSESMEEFVPEGMEEFVPQAGNSADLTAALELFSGTHEANVYVDGPDKARVQVLDRMSERNLISNGEEVWFYDSQTAQASHAVMPTVSAEQGAQGREAKNQLELRIREYAATKGFDLSTPAAIANALLSELDESTDVRTGTDSSVAGRGAYQLILEPKTAEALVSAVIFAVDAETGLPLRVQVFAKGQNDPAFSIGFTKITFETPAAENFEFTPPPGVTVTEIEIPTEAELEAQLEAVRTPELDQKLEELENQLEGKDLESLKLDDLDLKGLGIEGFTEADMPKLLGSGWGSIVELSSAVLPAEILENDFFTELTRAVDGGRLIETSLFNVLITDDGRMLAGSVTLEALLAAASAR